MLPKTTTPLTKRPDTNIELWTKKEQASKEAAKKAGATFIEDISKAEFSSAMKPVWDKFSPTPALQALVQKIVNTK